MPTKLTYRQARFAAHTLQEDVEDAHAHDLWLEKKAGLLEEVRLYEASLTEVKAKIENISRHIQWQELPEPEKFNRLLPGRKRLLDAVRMIAYRAEADIQSDPARGQLIEARTACRKPGH